MASLLSSLSCQIITLTTWTGRWSGSIEDGGVKVRYNVAFGTDHVFQTPVELYRFGPGVLLGERHFCLERGQRGVNAVDVLGVKAQQPALVGQCCEEVMESSWAGGLGLLREGAHHVME